MHACVALGCARTGGNSRELSATYMIRWKTVTYTIRWQKAPSVSVSYYNTVRVSRSGPPVVKRPCSVWSIVISLNPSSTRNCDVVHHPAKSLNPSASRSKVGLIQGCNYSITICEYTFHLKWQSTNHSYIFQMRHSPILLHHHFGLFNNQEDYRTLSIRPKNRSAAMTTDPLEMHPKAAIQRVLSTSLPRSFLCRGPPATKNLCVHYFGFVLAPATSVLKTALLAPVDQLIILCAWAGYNQTLHQFIHLYISFVSTSYSLMLVVQLLLMKWISLFLSIHAQLVQCIFFSDTIHAPSPTHNFEQV